MSFRSGDEQSVVFGHRLRERVSAIVKTTDMAHGVYGKRIGAHIMRSGGDTALYTKGVPLGVIHRWGRWKSLTSHQYLWRDATDWGALSAVIVKRHGMIHCIKLMNNEPNGVSFQHNCETMIDSKEDAPQADHSVTTALSLPNDRFTAGRSRSDSCAGLGSFVSPASDFPAYAASPSDHVTTFQGTRPLTKQGKLEKREKDESSDDGGRVAKGELFSGEEGASSKSSASSKSLVSREICPRGDDSSEFDSGKESSANLPHGPLGHVVHRRIEPHATSAISGPHVTRVGADQSNPDAGWLPGEGERDLSFLNIEIERAKVIPWMGLAPTDESAARR